MAEPPAAPPKADSNEGIQEQTTDAAEKAQPEQKWATIDPNVLLESLGVPETDANEPPPLQTFKVCQTPEIMVVPHFVSSAECMHLIDLAENSWPAIPQQSVAESMVPLHYAQTVIVESIEQRLAAIAGMPIEHLERIRVARYLPSQTPATHALSWPGHPKTVFVCLGDFPEECKTAFSALCLACTPRAGAAVMWPEVSVAVEATGSETSEDKPPQQVRPVNLEVSPPNESSGQPVFALACFFSASPIRAVLQPSSRGAEDLENAVALKIPDPETSTGTVQACHLDTKPRLTVFRRCLTDDEIDHLLDLSPTFRSPPEGDVPVTLGVLQPAGTPTIETIEAKLAAVGELPREILGRLRVVRSGRTVGYCNRGCGPKAMYVCLTETEEILFPHIGVKVLMQKGDAILWPNLSEQEGRWVVDLHTVRAHMYESVGLEVMFCDWPVRPPPQPQRPPPLQQGDELTLGEVSFRVEAPIGMGSFGVVWGAERLGDLGGSVVIKEVLSVTPDGKEPKQEAYEGELLRSLTEIASSSGSASAALARIPHFVAGQTELVGPNMWRVRFAMSKVPGMPLDHFFIKTAQEREQLRQEGKDVVSKVFRQDQFSKACQFSRQLVSQMAPTLEAISKLALHRDVNAHNILVDGDVENPHFYLVDFGLAVDNAKWYGPMTSLQSFYNFDIGGDCRMWPMAAWLMFVGGYDELHKYPPLVCEYSQLLDFHALGITAMQALASMSPMPVVPSAENGTGAQPQPAPAEAQPQPAPAEAPTDTDQSAEAEIGDGPGAIATARRMVECAQKSYESSKANSPDTKAEKSPPEASSAVPVEEDGLSDEVRHMLLLWHNYWAEAHKYWQYLFNSFRARQDFGPVKAHCSRVGVHNIVGQYLSWLRQTLHKCLQSTNSPLTVDAKALFSALLELLTAGLCDDPVPDSNGQSKEPGELQLPAKRPRSWEAVRTIIDEVGETLASKEVTANDPSPAGNLDPGCAKAGATAASQGVTEIDPSPSGDPDPSLPEPAKADEPLTARAAATTTPMPPKVADNGSPTAGRASSFTTTTKPSVPAKVLDSGSPKAAKAPALHPISLPAKILDSGSPQLGEKPAVQAQAVSPLSPSSANQPIKLQARTLPEAATVASHTHVSQAPSSPTAMGTPSKSLAKWMIGRTDSSSSPTKQNATPPSAFFAAQPASPIRPPSHSATSSAAAYPLQSLPKRPDHIMAAKLSARNVGASVAPSALITSTAQTSPAVAPAVTPTLIKPCAAPSLPLQEVGSAGHYLVRR